MKGGRNVMRAKSLAAGCFKWDPAVREHSGEGREKDKVGKETGLQENVAAGYGK